MKREGGDILRPDFSPTNANLQKSNAAAGSSSTEAPAAAAAVRMTKPEVSRVISAAELEAHDKATPWVRLFRCV